MNAPTLVKILPKVTEFLGLEPSFFVEGKRRASSSGEVSSIYNPATGEAITQVPRADVKDVVTAVHAAHRAHVDGRWRKLRPAERERILLKFADLVERDAEVLAQLETLEQGKSINISRAIEVAGGVEYMRYAAGLSTKITGMTLDVSMPAPPGGQYTAYTRREPVGVVAAIAPWNFPMAIALWKIMPALAAGCTLVLKPAEVTPLTALYLAQLALEAGVPAGVFNVVTGKGSTCGQALVSSPLVSKITFTGSTAVGKTIGRAAIENMTRVSLELGGKNPAIVLKDADLDVTVGGLMMGAFLNQGQVCAAVSRVYVEAEIYDKLSDAMSGAVSGLAVGPGLDEGAQVNPLVSATHRQTVAGYIEDAQKSGAELVQGKEGPEANGYYVRPTLVLNPDKAIRLTREEVFGPVLALTRVKDAEEALKLANDTEYGLSASLWTQNLNAAMNMIPRIEAGTVWVNSHVPIDPNLPFGGYKQSGIGRDFGPRWLDAYTEEKSVCIAH